MPILSSSFPHRRCQGAADRRAAPLGCPLERYPAVGFTSGPHMGPPGVGLWERVGVQSSFWPLLRQIDRQRKQKCDPPAFLLSSAPNSGFCLPTWHLNMSCYCLSVQIPHYSLSLCHLFPKDVLKILIIWKQRAFCPR